MFLVGRTVSGSLGLEGEDIIEERISSSSLLSSCYYLSLTVILLLLFLDIIYWGISSKSAILFIKPSSLSITTSLPGRTSIYGGLFYSFEDNLVKSFIINELRSVDKALPIISEALSSLFAFVTTCLPLTTVRFYGSALFLMWSANLALTGTLRLNDSLFDFLDSSSSSWVVFVEAFYWSSWVLVPSSFSSIFIT